MQEAVQSDAASIEAVARWTEDESKTRLDIVLTISRSEIKQIKDCETVRGITLKLKNIQIKRTNAKGCAPGSFGVTKYARWR